MNLNDFLLIKDAEFKKLNILKIYIKTLTSIVK